MMSKTVSGYIQQFKEGCVRNFGFAFAFFKLFTAIPAGLGHIIDSLFHINGIMFSKDPDENMCGPFGFILGLPFAIVGLAIGAVVQAAFSVVSLIGYAIDRFISFIVSRFHPSYKFHEAMVPPDGAESLRILSGLFQRFFYAPPLLMKGPFGFFFGLVPEIIRGICFKLLAIPTALINRVTGGISSAISRTLYKKKDQTSTEAAPQPVPKTAHQTEPTGTASEQPKPKRRRGVRFAPELQEGLAREEAEQTKGRSEKEQDDALLEELLTKKVDLFEIFGIDYSEEASKTYTKLLLTFAPDKFNDLFKPVLAEALTKKNQPSEKLTTVRRAVMTVGTFLSLTEINSDVVSDDEQLKKHQVIAFDKITKYKRVLDRPDLRERYMNAMRFPYTAAPIKSTADMMGAMGGSGSSPINEFDKKPPVAAPAAPSRAEGSNKDKKHRRIRVVDKSKQPENSFK